MYSTGSEFSTGLIGVMKNIEKSLTFFIKVLTYGNTFAILKTWLRSNQATINN